MPIDQPRACQLPRSCLLGIAANLAFVAAVHGGNPPATPADRVREVLADKCLACHSTDPKKGGLDLTRRASALLGLPPTPEEVRAFVDDPAPDAFERLVDRLLDSPRYGERWGRHWLDVVRFAESHGYETNALRPDAWPYRDYVIRAFNRDTPFARFVAEQLAGDAIEGADWLARSATGFIVAGPHDVVGNQATEAALQQRVDDLDDMGA